MKFRKYIILLLAACLQFPVWGQAKPKIPRPKDDVLMRAIVKPKSYVLDFEFLFLENENAILDNLILAFKQRTTNEIAILTLGNSQCDKENFRDYTLQLANAWGIGHKEKNNGILIAISKEFRQIQIHNGKGIETILTNDETKQIIDSYFIPKFKTQNYFEGTKNGFLALIKIVEEKQKKHTEIAYFTDKLIELIEQKKIAALQKLTTEKIYCYLCFPETPKRRTIS